MNTLPNKSSRITVPEGYTEIPIDWGNGEKLYVYINPNDTSQTVYIGSDKNYNTSERSKIITFETTNENGATSRANLNVIQAATQVNTIRNFWEYNINGEIISQEVDNSNTFNLPISTSSSDNITLKMYAQANINEGEEIRTYLPLTIVSQSSSNSKIHVLLEDTETLKITIDNPQDQTSDTLNLTVNGGPNGEYYWEELGITIGIVGAKLILVQAVNTYTVRAEKFQVNRGDGMGTILTSNSNYEVPRDGAPILYTVSYTEVKTYASGYVKNTPYNSSDNPEEFTVQFTQDPELPDNKVSWSSGSFVITVNPKTEITWSSTPLGVMVFSINSSEPDIAQTSISDTLTQQRNRFTIDSFYPHISFNKLVFASEETTLPTVEFTDSGNGSLDIIPAGGEFAIKSSTLLFNVTTESGDKPVLSYVYDNNSNNWAYYSDGDGVIDDVPLSIYIQDVQGEDSVTVNGGSIDNNIISAPSLGTNMYPNGRGFGSFTLYISNLETSNNTYYIVGLIDIEYEPNVFKANKVNSFEFTYPNIPAKGGTIHFDKFILSMDGNWTSGETQTGLIFSDLDNVKNSYLLPNYGVQMYLDEVAGNINTSKLPEDKVYDILGILIPDDMINNASDDFSLNFPKRVVNNTIRLINSKEIIPFEISIYIQDANGNNLFTDAYTLVSLESNRIWVNSIVDIHWLDSWNLDNYFMPAIGMDITEQLMSFMSCNLQVTFDSEEDTSESVVWLNVVGNVVDGTNNFINLDCTEDPNVHYNYAKLPLEWWSYEQATNITVASGMNHIHRSPLDDYIISTTFADGFKAKNLRNVDKTDVSTFSGISYYPDGLLLAPAIKAIKLAIPKPTTDEVLIVANTSSPSLISTDDGGIKTSWDKYANIPWQANREDGISILDRNNLVPTYYDPISRDWFLGLTPLNVDNPYSDYFPYDYYFEIVNNSYYTLHVIMPKEGGTIYLRDFRYIYTFRQSGFIDSIDDIINEESGNTFTFFNASEVPELKIVGNPPDTATLPGPSLFGIEVEANTTGLYRKMGHIVGTEKVVRLYNNNNSTLGRGTIITLCIEQKG